MTKGNARVILASVRIAIAVLLVAIPIVLIRMPRVDKPKPLAPPKRVEVRLVTLQRKDLTERAELPMVVAPLEDRFVRVSAEIGGKVIEVTKRAGDPVEEDEVILRVDTESLVAQRDSAKAAYDEAAKNYERMKDLDYSRAISKEQVETAAFVRDRLRAVLRQTEIAVEKATVRSPITGTLDRRHVDRGELVAVGEPLADVANIDRLYAVVQIPEKNRQYVFAGKPMRLVFEKATTANPGESFVVYAPVRSISDIGDEATRTYRAMVEFENPGRVIKPGMIGRAGLELRTVKDAIVVDWDWIQPVSGEYNVYVEVAGAAMPRKVRLGITDGEQVQVLQDGDAGDPLQPGDRIITNPRQLSGGDFIRVRSIDEEEVPSKPLPPPWELGRMVAKVIERLHGREDEDQ